MRSKQEFYIGINVHSLLQTQHREEGYFHSLQGIYHYSDDELEKQLENVRSKWAQNIKDLNEYMFKYCKWWWSKKKVQTIAMNYNDGWSAPFRKGVDSE